MVKTGTTKGYDFREFIIAGITAALIILISCDSDKRSGLCGELKVSDNGRYLEHVSGEPFFWLGDTGWLLFSKLTREEADLYLDDRQSKGFNVIQVMILHNTARAVNVYGDSALAGGRIDRPFVTPGSSFDDADQYDYWDHIDYIIDRAAQKGIYMALVPVWGSNVRNGSITAAMAGEYAAWLAGRYSDRENVIWLNGGDVKGSDSPAVWNIIGETISQISQDDLITFHPFGRTRSSEWFHDAPWLDFNMFQSGHRRYDQDTSGSAFGEDNWKYVNIDFNLSPAKPTLDGEPSYESIPQGLHDPEQPYWTVDEVRRYAYWSVFAGACGFTYGHNAIMQFHRQGDTDASYSVRETWKEALDAPGALQMRHLKDLISEEISPGGIPAQDLVAGPHKPGYDYIAAIKDSDCALFYTWNGSTITVESSRLQMPVIRAFWFNPRDGTSAPAGRFNTGMVLEFDPPGDRINGNDWVLVLRN